jgi:hypothetical protein
MSCEIEQVVTRQKSYSMPKTELLRTMSKLQDE